MAPASEPTQVSATASLLPNVEVLVPSPAVEVQGPPPTTEVAESYSVRVALTVEGMRWQRSGCSTSRRSWR
jgi:hypothetical protein